MTPTKTELIDLFWRCLWTAVQAFTGALLGAGTGLVDVSVTDAAQIAALGAVLSVIKTFASNHIGTGTAGTTPPPAGLPAPVASNIATPA